MYNIETRNRQVVLKQFQREGEKEHVLPLLHAKDLYSKSDATRSVNALRYLSQRPRLYEPDGGHGYLYNFLYNRAHGASAGRESMYTDSVALWTGRTQGLE